MLNLVYIFGRERKSRYHWSIDRASVLSSKVNPDGNGARYRYVALIEFRSLAAGVPLLVKPWPVLAGIPSHW